MRHTKTFILLAFAAFLLFACSKEEPTPEPQQAAVPQIILDTDIDKILPAMSRFGGGGNRSYVKTSVIRRLREFFEKYLGL